MIGFPWIPLAESGARGEENATCRFFTTPEPRGRGAYPFLLSNPLATLTQNGPLHYYDFAFRALRLANPGQVRKGIPKFEKDSGLI